MSGNIKSSSGFTILNVLVALSLMTVVGYIFMTQMSSQDQARKSLKTKIDLNEFRNSVSVILNSKKQCSCSFVGLPVNVAKQNVTLKLCNGDSSFSNSDDFALSLEDFYQEAGTSNYFALLKFANKSSVKGISFPSPTLLKFSTSGGLISECLDGSESNQFQYSVDNVVRVIPNGQSVPTWDNHLGLKIIVKQGDLVLVLASADTDNTTAAYSHIELFSGSATRISPIQKIWSQGVDYNEHSWDLFRATTDGELEFRWQLYSCPTGTCGGDGKINNRRMMALKIN